MHFWNTLIIKENFVEFYKRSIEVFNFEGLLSAPQSFQNPGFSDFAKFIFLNQMVIQKVAHSEIGALNPVPYLH